MTVAVVIEVTVVVTVAVVVVMTVPSKKKVMLTMAGALLFQI